MRILHFYKTALPDSMGGVEQVIHQIARGTTTMGARVDVLSLSADGTSMNEARSGYTTHRVKMDFPIASTSFSTRIFKHFTKLANEVDLIHYHFPWPFMDLVHFLCNVRKPSLVTYHSDIIRQKYLLKLYRPLQRAFLQSVDAIVATSPNYMATSPVLQNYTDKVRIIPIGIDRSLYPEPREDRLQFWKQKLPKRFFLFVGVLRYYKGLHILIEAARSVPYPIVIVGSGPIEAELMHRVKQLKLKHIIFLGHLSDENKVTLFSLCYAVLFPSNLRSEAFGVSLLEGAMYGKPMVSSEIGTGTTFINMGDETGLVVPPDNASSLAQAMRFLWENPSKAALMGLKAKERYHQYFTADKMAESYVNLYKTLLKIS